MSDREYKKLQDRIQELEAVFGGCKEKLRSVFISSPTAITVTDLEGKITDCNQATLDLHDFSSKEEVIGKSAFDLIAKKDHERAMQNLKKTLEEGVVKNIEYTFVTRVGREFPAELFAALVRDAQGKPAAFMATTMDISRRKQAEEEVKNSEERLKILFEDAPDAYLLNDAQGRFVDCNRAAEKLTGYKREELIGKKFTEIKLLSQKELQKALTEFSKTIQGETTRMEEYLLIRKDGSQAIVEIRARPIKVRGQIMTLAIMRDITARRYLENELRIKDRTIESDLSGHVISDLKGNIAYTNKAFKDMWGFENDLEVLGKPATEFWQDKKQASRVIEDLQRTGRWMGEMVAKRKDGSTFKVALSASIATDVKGEPISMTGSFVEVIERRPVSVEVPEMEQMLGETYPEAVGAVLLISRDFKILWANEKVLKQTGYKLQEIVGNHCYKILHNCDGPCKLPKNVCPIKEAIRTGTVITVFHTHFDKRGNEIYVEETVSPFKEGKAGVDKFVDKIRDITFVLKMSEF